MTKCLTTQDFETCCICECESTPDNQVVNFIDLPYKTPVPGTGWGNMLWQMPADGAIAAICDRCADSEEILELKFLC